METNAKIVICNKDKIACTKEVIAKMENEARQGAYVISLDEIEQRLEEIHIKDEFMICEPIKSNDVESDVCLIIWDYNDDGLFKNNKKFTQADAFLSSMNLCFETGMLWDGPTQKISSYLLKKIFE